MIPDLSVLWVVFFVLLLVGILDRLLFKPVLRVMHAREGAIKAARDLAETSAAKATAAAAEFEMRTNAARAEVYRQMDENRRIALERRAVIVAEARREAEAAISAATERLKNETQEARARLAGEAEQLGNAVVARVLGRDVSLA